MWPLRGVLGGVILEYLTPLRRVPRAMQQAYFPSGWPIDRMDCISCLVFSSAARLRFDGRGGFSSLLVPSMTGTVNLP